jgi:hypothetical protein
MHRYQQPELLDEASDVLRNARTKQNPAISRQPPTAQNDTHQEPQPPTGGNQLSDPAALPRSLKGRQKLELN